MNHVLILIAFLMWLYLLVTVRKVSAELKAYSDMYDSLQAYVKSVQEAVLRAGIDFKVANPPKGYPKQLEINENSFSNKE